MAEYECVLAENCIDKEAECCYSYGTNHVFYPHSHDFYEIYLNISGTATHHINGTVQKLPKGSLVFIRPDDLHTYTYDTCDNPEGKETSYVNLSFNDKTAKLLFDYILDEETSKGLLHSKLPPIVILNKTDKNRLLSQLEELNVLNWDDKKSLKLRLRALLADILVRYFCNAPKSSERDIPDWLVFLLQEMEKEQNFVGGIDKMISLSKKSYEHLSRSIKKYYGITLSEYINDLRINYASNLLLRTNTPIIEICFNCGFLSVSNFYKVFGAKYSMSPSEFRKL